MASEMRVEDLLEERLKGRGKVGGVNIPDQETEVAELVRLAGRLGQLGSAELRPRARRRLAERLARRMNETRGDVQEAVEPVGNPDQPEARLFRQLANRLGVSCEEMWRYIGPAGAAKVGRFLGVPGYSAMFDLLGFLLRTFRRLESFGSTL